MQKKRLTESRPLVSVIMPVYNAEAFIGEAVESIKNQTWQNWELICVDDCSTDNSYVLLKTLAKGDNRIRILRNKNKQYLAGSLNFALQRARGKYIARMDADDISLPCRLEKQVSLLESDKHLIAVGGQLEVIDEWGSVIGEKYFPVDYRSCRLRIMNTMVIQPPLLMARAWAMKKFQYDTEIAKNDDIDMHFKLIQTGEFSNVNEIIFQYRKRLSSYTFSDPRAVFLMALRVRLRAVSKYHYRPSAWSLLLAATQAVVVLLLPKTLLISLFEMIRYSKRGSASLMSLSSAKLS